MCRIGRVSADCIENGISGTRSGVARQCVINGPPVVIGMLVKRYVRALRRCQGGRTWERDKRKQRQEDADCAKTETD